MLNIIFAWYVDHTWYWYEYVLAAILAWIVMYFVQTLTLRSKK